MDINQFQKELGTIVNQALKDSIPQTQVIAVLDMLSFELKFKLMRQLEKQNELPFKMELEDGGKQDN